MNPLVGLFRDLVAILPEKNFEADSQSAIDPRRETVVFVSGFGAPQRGLHIMKRRLLRDGYNVVLFSLHWQDFSGGIPDMARALGREILSLKKLAPSAPIHLVAHSAGGIVARFYVQVLGGSHYCETLTTLATPHHGTWLALLGFLSHLAVLWRCLIQLSPRSRLLRKLNGAPIPSDMRLVSIYSTDDIVCRSGSTRLPLEYAESPNVASFAIGGLSHSDFVLSKKGYQLIRTVLKSWGKGLPNDILAAINT